MGQRSKRAVPGEADYVVVGAGSAGCVLAARLAASGARVVLVEAGGSDRTTLVRKPGLIAAVHSVPQLKARLDWGYYSVPQSEALGRRIPQTRGKVLGGSGLGQRHAVRAGQRGELRLLGRRGLRGLVLRRCPAELQEAGELGGRRDRVPRRRRPDQGPAADRRHDRHARLHGGVRRHRRREGPRGLQRRVAGRHRDRPAEC